MSAMQIDVPLSAKSEESAEMAEPRDITVSDLPEPTTSARDRLKAKLAAERAKVIEGLSFKIPVPRMPMIVVEFFPVSNKQWNGLLEMAGKTGMEPLETNSRMLALFVKGVWLDDDGALVSADLDDPQAAPPQFDKRLADALGLPWDGLAWHLTQEIYATDGDIISTAAALLDLSGYQRGQEIEATVRGN